VVLALALGLGLLAAVAASCGSTGVRGGLPATRADVIKREVGDVQEFVARGDCQDLNGQLRQVDQEIDNLPPSVDQTLVDNLRQGSARLRDTAVQACNEPETTTQTDTVPAAPVTTDTTPTTPPDTVTETIPTTTDVVPPPATTPPATTAPDQTAPAPTPTTPGSTGPGGAAAPDGTTG
jgi:hypothetical protein